jgi:hypothetical protein
MPERRILVPEEEWLASGWEQLPLRRIDLAGRPGEVFVAQYAGDLATPETLLQAAGWTASPIWTWRDSLPYLNPKAALAELPPRPSLHEGLKARLTLTRPVAGSDAARLVLRFYQTPLALAQAGVYRPIYLVSLGREASSHGLGLYAIPQALPATEEDLALFRAWLRQGAGLQPVAARQREGAEIDLVTAAP